MRALALLLACSFSAALADELSVEAKQEAAMRFERGVKLYNAQDYAAALAEFEAAHRRMPDWRVLFNIGVARKRLFRYNDAVRALRRYLDEGGDKVPADRRALVEQELAEIRALVAEVTVTVEGPPAQIEVDGRPMGETPLPSPLLVAAGNHIVRAAREGYDPAQREIDVVSGQKIDVRLSLAIAQRERQKAEELQRRKDDEARARQLADEAALVSRVKPAQMALCETDGGFAFCTERGRLTENAFVRSYRELTGAGDLDWAKRNRSVAVLAVTGVLAFVVAPALFASELCLYDHGGGENSCVNGDAHFVETFTLAAVSLALFAADLPAFIYYAVKRDGRPTQHTLTREQAHAAVERYNQALLERAKRGLPLPMPTSQRESRFSLAPYAGPSGFGLTGRF